MRGLFEADQTRPRDKQIWVLNSFCFVISIWAPSLQIKQKGSTVIYL